MDGLALATLPPLFIFDVKLENDRGLTKKFKARQIDLQRGSQRSESASGTLCVFREGSSGNETSPMTDDDPHDRADGPYISLSLT